MRNQAITLSVFLALIAASFAAAQSSKSSSDSLDHTLDAIFAPSTQQADPSPVTSVRRAANEGNCTCVPYNVCLNGTINTAGFRIIDARSPGVHSMVNYTFTAESDSSSSCENYLDICCKLPNVLEPEETTPTSTNVATNRKNCGQRKPDGVKFSKTGDNDNEAQFGEFPWMVAILHEEVIGFNAEKLNVYQCGGALIHSRAVLTSAFCVNGKQVSRLKVRAGEWNSQTRDEILPHQDRNVESVIVHEKFNPDTLHNDIAIVILKTAVDIAENVDVVCLPSQGEIFDAARCFASGWGKDKFGAQGKYQSILKKLELPIVPHDECQTYLRKTRLGKYFILNRSFICAGGEASKDTCKGDGGGPLVCPLKSDPSRYVQAGIVAWGIGCGHNQVPGVYANVAHFRQWIDEQMLHHNLDITV